MNVKDDANDMCRKLYTRITYTNDIPSLVSILYIFKM